MRGVYGIPWAPVHYQGQVLHLELAADSLTSFCMLPLLRSTPSETSDQLAPSQHASDTHLIRYPKHPNISGRLTANHQFMLCQGRMQVVVAGACCLHVHSRMPMGTHVALHFPAGVCLFPSHTLY